MENEWVNVPMFNITDQEIISTITNPVEFITLPIRTLDDDHVFDEIEPHILLLNDLYRYTTHRQYNLVPAILEQLADHDCSQYQLTVELTTPPQIIESLRDIDLHVEFCMVMTYNGWEDVVNVIKNSPRPIKIETCLTSSYALIVYIQLTEVPYLLSYGYYNRAMDWINELIPEDIDRLNDQNKAIVHKTYLTLDLRISGWNYTLLRRSGYIGWSMYPLQGVNLLKIGSYIPWLSQSIFNRYRTDKDYESLYTHSSFNQYWRELSPEEIVQGSFDSEHLDRIGVEVPHVDLVLREDRIDLVKLKRLLPYSTPSDELVRSVLQKLDDYPDECHHLKVILTIAQYKKSVLYQCADHPLIQHLIEVTSNKLTITKSARNIDDKKQR